MLQTASLKEKSSLCMPFFFITFTKTHTCTCKKKNNLHTAGLPLCLLPELLCRAFGKATGNRHTGHVLCVHGCIPSCLCSFLSLFGLFLLILRSTECWSTPVSVQRYPEWKDFWKSALIYFHLSPSTTGRWDCNHSLFICFFSSFFSLDMYFCNWYFICFSWFAVLFINLLVDIFAH